MDDTGYKNFMWNKLNETVRKIVGPAWIESRDVMSRLKHANRCLTSLPSYFLVWSGQHEKVLVDQFGEKDSEALWRFRGPTIFSNIEIFEIFL